MCKAWVYVSLAVAASAIRITRHPVAPPHQSAVGYVLTNRGTATRDVFIEAPSGAAPTPRVDAEQHVQREKLIPRPVSADYFPRLSEMKHRGRDATEDLPTTFVSRYRGRERTIDVELLGE